MDFLELNRLLEHRERRKNWKNWGPYLSERAWGTVREDYGKESPWTAFPFDEAHRLVYKWGEDGLAGICNRFQTICFSLALWNGKDPILKERLFGLSNKEGNHGEDVKELYQYLDATPTSSYLKMLYKYPQREFPYKLLRDENQKRGLGDREYEITDTGIFAEDRYFDVLIEYAKADMDDLSCKISITNKGPEAASLTVLPTIWFRNTWQWGEEKPKLFEEDGCISLGEYFFFSEGEYLFCDNDENVPYPKDAIGRHIIEGADVNPKKEGTKAAAKIEVHLQPGETRSIYCRISKQKEKSVDQALFEEMKHAADTFYQSIQRESLSEEMKTIQRRALAGMLFSKQFYNLDQIEWEKGKHSEMRNQQWQHLTTFDILSMPDKWEYPYFCAWDMAFHCLSLVLIDPDFAKRQLTLMTREWYMHPNGQLPSYEWAFSDVNPPVHAWALWRTYKIDEKRYGVADRSFLEGNFHKLLLNFTWWVNQKDPSGKNVFQGGFLGMDNISVFDRSKELPTGGHIDQSDGSAWMGFYCLSLMKIALHLAEKNPIYEDMATKFFEHYLRIAYAMTHCGDGTQSLWDEQDGFFYDLLHLPNGEMIHLKVRSLVGLLPLLAVETLDPELVAKMPVFERRMKWFISKRPDISSSLACMYDKGQRDRRLISIVTKDKLQTIFGYLFDENEFLSPYGIRSLSKCHEKNPYIFDADGQTYEVKYVPGESDNKMFGGNSNWRGPIWFPTNYLLIEALQKYHHYYGDELKVEYPTGSGHFLNLWDIATDLSKRLISLCEKDDLFYEYYHGDTGEGLGASHQTGWTGLVAKLIEQSG